ncbi:choice-of-anchor D domain-containing protein [Myxococcota bacterium]|nr:choice-of-anchor D domain-containing protein [Myxococcota bacterium]
MERRLFFDLRMLLVAAVAVAGCECGEDGLVDTTSRLGVTPRALDFGDVLRGDLRVLAVELSSSGSTPLRITRAELASPTGEHIFAAPVPEALAPQQRVMISIAYQPTDLGEDLGTITFAADDGEAPIVVDLRGVGVEATLGVDTGTELCAGQPGSISFGEVRPGSDATRTITLSPAGGTAIEILSAIVEPGTSGEFSIDGSTLPRTLAPGESIALTARYAPSDGGADTGYLVITTNATDRPSVRIPVCGTGIAPAICARPVPLDLGAVAEGGRVTGRMTIESCGAEPLAIESLALANDAQHPTRAGFALTSVPTLPATLAPGETVDVDVAFDAALPFGLAQGWIEARSNADGNAVAYFAVQARVATPCSLLVAPAQLLFRDVAAGASAEKNVLVGNVGESDCGLASLTITSTTGGSEFSLVAPPATPLVLAAGASLTVRVRYAPATMGPHVATLVVEDAGAAQQSVVLRGNPPEQPGCAVEVVPSVLSFGLTAIGSMTRMEVRVVAVGEEPCRVTSATLVGMSSVFTIDLPALRTAFPGVGGVDIGVIYMPTAAVASTDVLRIDATELGGSSTATIDVGITAGAADAQLCVMPASLDFGTVPAGSSATLPVSISSCGAVAVTLRGLVLSNGTGSAFRIATSPTLPQSIAAGALAAPALSITYAPQDAGPHFGQVEILSSDPDQPSLVVPLVGNFAGGCDRVLQCTPANVSFGTTAIGTQDVVRVVCRSLGSAAVTVSSVNLSGGTPVLGTSARTPVVIQPGDAWTFDVRHTPNGAVTTSGTVTLTSDACVAPSGFAVEGTGLVRELPDCIPPSTFQPVEEWSWRSTSIEPASTNVWSTPMVANLDDDDRDGRISETDVPDVVFVSVDTFSVASPGEARPGVLRVLSGDTGAEKFSVTEPRIADASIPAVGDLDGDGKPEIIGLKWVQTPAGTGTGGLYGRHVTGTMVALDNEGHLLWESDPWVWPEEILENASAPSIADLDADGLAEIVLGRDVYDHRGTLLWRGAGDHGRVTAGVHSAVADIDLDGVPEVLAGSTVYRNDGTVLWDLPGVSEGGVAVGMLDSTDPFPQIALHTGTSIIVMDHLGVEKWRASIPSSGPATMLPTIADFDGDGDGDIAIADGMAMHVFHGTGGIAWSAPVSDSTCCAGISAFDFEGDGAAELILHDYGTVYVHRGTNGDVIYQASRPSVTAYEMPVVADVDNDGKAELVEALFETGGNGGIVVYSNVQDDWVGAPRIWNQQAFHVTNVYESGAIPRVEAPIPQSPHVFRGTAAACD